MYGKLLFFKIHSTTTRPNPQISMYDWPTVPSVRILFLFCSVIQARLPPLSIRTKQFKYCSDIMEKPFHWNYQIILHKFVEILKKYRIRLSAKYSMAVRFAEIVAQMNYSFPTVFRISHNEITPCTVVSPQVGQVIEIQDGNWSGIFTLLSREWSWRAYLVCIFKFLYCLVYSKFVCKDIVILVLN